MYIDTDIPVTPVAIIATANSTSSASYSYLTDGTNTASLTTYGSQKFIPGKPEDSARTQVAKCMAQTVVADTLYTLHTVTALKKLYVTSITAGIATAGKLRFGDNISGATWTSGTTYTDSQLFQTIAAGGGTGIYTFNPPLVISTALKYESDQGVNVSISVFGWEE